MAAVPQSQTFIFWCAILKPVGLWVQSTSFLLVRGACCLAMQINAQSTLHSDAINLLIRGCADYLILIRWNTGQAQECLSFQGHSLHVSDKSIETAWDGVVLATMQENHLPKGIPGAALSVQQCCWSGKAVHGGENSMESWILLLSIFLSKQSSGQRQMTFQYDLLYMYPWCSIKWLWFTSQILEASIPH